MKNTPTFPLASTSRDGKGAHMWAACLSCHVKAEGHSTGRCCPELPTPHQSDGDRGSCWLTPGLCAQLAGQAETHARTPPLLSV